MEDNNKPTPPPSGGAHTPYEDFDTYHGNRNTALTNAADTEIAPLLTAAGYTPAIIALKVIELAALKKLDDIQKKEYGEQYQATKVYDDLAATLHNNYLLHVNFGKLIFSEDLAATNFLGLNGRRKQAENAYCNQALLFYGGVLDNASYKAAVNARGITDAQLNAGKAGYTTLKNMIPTKAKETGEAQMATSKRDDAWENFEDWFANFKKYAILALSIKPQLREKMGWKE